MNDEFRRAAAMLHDVNGYQQLFSVGSEADIKSTYRKLLKTVHPDVVDERNRLEANDVLWKLAGMYEEAIRALSDGTFGAPKPILVLRSNGLLHEGLTKQTRWFDMTTGFAARSTSGAQSQASLLKVAKRPQDNDLMVREADALRVLADSGDEHVMYYPVLLDSLVVPDGRRRIRANVTIQLDGFVNLEEVRQRYPGGIQPLDMGWIWRRVLWALGGVHEANLLHGAVVPSHIMINPTLHGVVLVDWCYSLQRTGSGFPVLNAIVGRHRNWYPESVLNRTAPTASLDLALAARSMQYVMGSASVPPVMQRYFSRIGNGTTHESAYELLAQFDQILERLGAPYYPRSYRPLNW